MYIVAVPVDKDKFKERKVAVLYRLTYNAYKEQCTNLKRVCIEYWED